MERNIYRMETRQDGNEKIIPEIIYVKYDDEQFHTKFNEQEIIIQIRPEDQEQHIVNEYHDEPELCTVHEVKSDNGLKNNNEIVVNEYYTHNYDNEVSNAVTSIENSLENSQENVINFVPALVEIKRDVSENKGNSPVLMFACKNIDEKEINKYICKHCGLVVGCIYCLKSHYESIHLKLGVIQYQCSQVLSVNINNTDICPKCKLICASRDEVVEHRKLHFVTCGICDMSFDSLLHLANHCKVMHDNVEVILNCDLCEESCRGLIALSEHYQNSHQMIVCIVCLKRFSTNADLEQHHKSHAIVLSAEAPLPFACSKCDMAFNTINELSKHLTMLHAKKRKITTS